uniref:Oligoribonuclease, mitochondrial n=1 Tax=Caligus clemensi TaxID=344056 RepID=C1C326_CALCM|nr:Oligoribonuclease, mitochondrial precursor [Caligus clemensi]
MLLWYEVKFKPMNLCSGRSLFNSFQLGSFSSSLFRRRLSSGMPPNNPSTNLRRLVWIDCEMTGLDIEKDVLMEVAVIVTDSSLREVTPGINLIIHQPDSILNAMTEFPEECHALTGLTEACRASQTDLRNAEDQICRHIRQGLSGTTGTPLLAGNSVGHDLKFLQKYMPAVKDLLHYKVLDVSSINSCYQLWNKSVLHQCPKKKRLHRAMEDIKESIEEMKVLEDIMFGA